MINKLPVRFKFRYIFFMMPFVNTEVCSPQARTNALPHIPHQPPLLSWHCHLWLDSGPAVQENTIPATNTSGGNYLHQLHNLPFDFVASAAPTQFPRPDDTGSMGALSSNIFTTIGSSGAMNLLASASAASAPASVPTMSGRHGHGQGMDMGFSAESTMRGPGPSTSSHSFPSSSSGGATINGGAPSFHGAGTASSSVDTSSSPRKKKTGEKRKSYVQDIVFFTEEMVSLHMFLPNKHF